MSGRSLEEILLYFAQKRPRNLTLAEAIASHTAGFVSDYCITLSALKEFEAFFLTADSELNGRKWHSFSSPEENDQPLSEYLKSLMPVIEEAEELMEKKRLFMTPELFRSGLKARLEFLDELLHSMSPLSLLVHEHFIKLNNISINQRPFTREKMLEDGTWPISKRIDRLSAIRDNLLRKWDIQELENYLEEYRLLTEEPSFPAWLRGAYPFDDSALVPLEDMTENLEVQVLWQKATAPQ